MSKKEKEKKPLEVYIHPETVKCRLFLDGIDISRYVKSFGHDFAQRVMNPYYRVELMFHPNMVQIKSTTNKMLTDERKARGKTK